MLTFDERQGLSNKAGEIAGRAIALTALCLATERQPVHLAAAVNEIIMRAEQLRDQLITETND